MAVHSSPAIYQGIEDVINEIITKNLYHFHPGVALTVFRNSGSPALSLATTRSNGRSHVIDTFSQVYNGAGGSYAANRVVEYGIYNSQTRSGNPPTSDVDAGFWNGRRLRMWWRQAYDGVGVPGAGVGDCFSGMQIGSFNANAPWTGLAPATQGIVQVRMYQKQSFNKIGLLVGPDTVTVPTEVIGTITPTVLANEFNLFELDLNLNAGYIRVYYTSGDYGVTQPRVLVCEQTDTDVLPPTLPFGIDMPFISMVQNTGTNACGRHHAVSNWWVAISET